MYTTESANLEDDNKINSRKFQRFWHFFAPTHNFFFVRHVRTYTKYWRKKLSCAVSILFLQHTEVQPFLQVELLHFLHLRDEYYQPDTATTTCYSSYNFYAGQRWGVERTIYGETEFASRKLELIATQIYKQSKV